MKVLEKGNFNTDWHTIISCTDSSSRPGCSALLEINADDLDITFHKADGNDQFDNDYYSVLVICPECENKITLGRDVVPEIVLFWTYRNKSKKKGAAPSGI